MNPAGSPISLFGPPLSRTRDLLGRYAFALLVVAVAAGMRYLLQVFFGFTPTYTTFYSAVMVVAVLAGLGPGLAATLLSCFVAAYFFVQPRGSFAIAAVGDRIALAAFFATGAAISLLAEFMRRRNAELTRNKLDLSNAQAIAQVGSWYLDIADHQLIWSEETYRLFHIPLGTPLSLEKFFACVHPEDSSTVSQAWSDTLLGAPYDLEHRILVDGQTRWVHQRAKIAFDTAGKPRFATGAVQDITERKCAEQRLQRLNRTLQSLSECADALMRATDESAVLQQVCDSVVQVGGYRMSWVGYVEQDEYKSVRSVAQAGFEEGYLNKANISWADVERGRGPTGTSIRTGKVVVSNDAASDPSFVPWRQEALQRRYRSSIALPLRSEKEVFGALTIYSDEAAAFDTREQRLLEELANNLTYAILTLRAHAGRNRAQEALRRSEAELKEAQRVARLGSWNLDLKTGAVHWSEELFRMFGLDPSLPAPPYPEQGRIFAPLSWAQLTAQVDETLRTGASYELELQTLRPGECNGWMLVRGERIRDDNGAIAGLQGVALDITQRKHAEEALQVSEIRYRRLFETAQDGILILDFATGQVMDVNQFLVDLLGYSHGELAGKKIWDIGPVKDIFASRSAFADLQSKGVVRYEDLPLETKDGRRIEVAFVSNVYTVDRQQVIQCNIRNITERKQMEKEIELSKAHAVSSARLSDLGLMAGSVAHEINNPLAVIHASASDLLELAESQNVPLDALLTAATRIKKTAERITKIVKSLRQISRDGAADPFQRASVAEIAKQALELCSERFRVHSVRLDIPAVDPALHISCREVQIAQVLLNLLQNAFDAVSDLEAGKWVRLDVTTQNHSVVFSVSDSGPGVPPEIKSRIMDPFFTTKPVGKGTGLGLSLSKAMVEEHGGELKLDETSQQTTFSFSIPLLLEETNATQGRYSFAR